MVDWNSVGIGAAGTAALGGAGYLGHKLGKKRGYKKGLSEGLDTGFQRGMEFANEPHLQAPHEKSAADLSPFWSGFEKQARSRG